MRQVLGVQFSPEEREQISRAKRWIGLHPLADEKSERRVSGRAEAEGRNTVRIQLQGMLNGLTDDWSPVFRERIDQARTALNEMLVHVQPQVSAQYWIARECTPGQANVLADSRAEALEDLYAVLAVLDAAAPLAQTARPPEDDDEPD
jgi:hypothetical protein